MANVDDLADFKATVDIVAVMGANVQFKASGKKLKCLCPFHDDQHPSMDVDCETQKYKCWSCGESGDVLDFIQKTHSTDLKGALDILGYQQWRDGRNGKPSARPVKEKSKNPFDDLIYIEEYTYEDIDGLYLSTKARFTEKDGGRKTFRRGIKNKRDIPGFNERNFIWKLDCLNGNRNLLFRASSVAKAIAAGIPIYLNEGEKSVFRIEAAGGVATCSPEGATALNTQTLKWDPSNTEALRGAKIILIADRDEVGERHAAMLASELVPVAASLVVVSSKTLNPKDDAYDHLEAGFGLSDFVERPDLHPDNLAATQKAKRLFELGIDSLATVEPVQVEWLWYPYIPIGRLTLVEGDGDQGKSYFTCAIAAGLTLGVLPGGERLPGPRNVLILASEDRADDTIVPRIIALGGDKTKIFHWPVLFPFDRKGIERLSEACSILDPSLVIIDPILGYISASVDINSATSVRPVFDQLGKVAEKHKIALLNIRHHGKPMDGRPSKHAGLGSVDIRNIHRSQLTITPHSDIRGLRVVRHEKHNYSPEGAVFGYEFRENQFFWRWDIPGEERPAGRPKPKREDAIVFLRGYFGTATVALTANVIEEGKQRGFSKDTLYRALEDANGFSSKAGYSDGQYRWTLPSAEEVNNDPFA